jgi:predicted DNA-binding antitoxin AbrB/MazE fold protein
MNIIDAVYAGGVFKPLARVSLPENQRVRLTIEEKPVEDVAQWLAAAWAFQQEVADRHGIVHLTLPRTVFKFFFGVASRTMIRTDWHRLFGLLTDFFTGSPFVVELEKDLSVKKQLLDVVVLRRRPGPFAGRLPTGSIT